MIKFIIYFSLPVLLFFLLSQNNGIVLINWLGYQIEIELIFLIPVLIVLKIIILKAFLLCLNIKKNTKFTKQVNAIENIINALSYIKIGESLAASACINRAQALFKDQAIIKLLKANNELLNNNSDNAKRHLMEIIKKQDILSITALNQLLVIAYADDNLLEIKSIVHKIASMFPKEPWSILKQGEFFCYTKQYIEGIQMLQKITHCKLKLEYDLKDRISILHYGVAQQAYVQGDCYMALNQLKQSINCFGTVLLKATILSKIGKSNKALHILKQKYNKDPHRDIWKLFLKLGGDTKALHPQTDSHEQNRNWQCIACHTKLVEWDYICTKCNKLDTIRWL